MSEFKDALWEVVCGSKTVDAGEGHLPGARDGDVVWVDDAQFKVIGVTWQINPADSPSGREIMQTVKVTDAWEED